jgi:hypothetical protein
MQTHMPDIQRALTEYFQKSFMSNKANAFESALDWCVEGALREGLDKAMQELNFKEMIAAKAKEILSDSDFIKNLAEAKVRSSLGLPSL